MKAKHFVLKLTKREFNDVGAVLDQYIVDCPVNTKRLAAIERVVRKIIKEKGSHD